MEVLIAVALGALVLAIYRRIRYAARGEAHCFECQELTPRAEIRCQHCGSLQP